MARWVGSGRVGGMFVWCFFFLVFFLKGLRMYVGVEKIYALLRMFVCCINGLIGIGSGDGVID